MIISKLLILWFAASGVGLFVSLLIAAMDLEYYAPFDCDIWLGPLSVKNLILSSTLTIIWGFACGIFNIPFWLPS